MGGARDTFGGRGEVPAGFWYGNIREIDLVVDRRVILKRIFKE